MKKRKAIPLLAAVSIMLLSHSSVIATAVDDNHQVNLSNDYLSCIVEQDSESLEYLRFGMFTNLGNVNNTNDDDRFLLYNNFFTGYTSVNVGGNTYLYGTGKDTAEPFVNNNNIHISSQNFGGIEIRQELTFDKGLTDVYSDMLRVSYTITNNGEETEAGLRILLDPMLDEDDSAVLYANGAKVSGESDFISDIPEIWSLQSVSSETEAYGKLSGTSVPDRMVYANWDKLYDNRWDYSIDLSDQVDDSAVAFYWNPKKIKNGESITCTLYYGVGNKIKTEESSIEESQNSSVEDSVIEQPSNPSETVSEVSNDPEPSVEKASSEPIRTESKTESLIQNAVADEETPPQNYMADNGDAIGTGDIFPVLAGVIVIVSAFAIVILTGRRRKHNED